MKLFTNFKKKKPAEQKQNAPETELDSGIPSVNKRGASSKVVTFAGFGIAILVAVVGLYMSGDGKKKESGDQAPNKAKPVQQIAKNEMPELDLKPEEPEPIAVSSGKGPRAPAIESDGSAGQRTPERGSAGQGGPSDAQPIDVARSGGYGNQPAALSWFDRKRLSGSRRDQEQRQPARSNDVQQVADDDTPAQQDSMRVKGAACPPGEDCPQAKKSALAARLDNAGRVSMVKASVLPNRDFLITFGTSLDASLDFAIDSTQPGIVKATLSRDVSSANGHVVLMEKGTVLTGKSEGDLQQGQARIFISWVRAETPNGVIVSLNSPSADALGRAGLDGFVDTKFKERFGAAMLVSLIKDSSTAIIQRKQSGGGTFVFGNTASAGDKVVEKTLDSTVNISPVLTKNQGEHINIIAAVDIDFSSVYQLKARKQ